LRLGVTPEEARRHALVALGGLEQTKEVGREAWALRWLQDLAQDLRFASRTYRKSPGFVTVVVLTLAIGIGLNVALFTVVNTLFWAPPRVHDPSRVVEFGFWKQNYRRDQNQYPFCSYFQYLTIKESATPLSSVAAYVVRDGDSPYGRWSGRLVSSNYLDLLGAGMALGRNFSADEERTQSPVIVLSYRTWQKVLGGDRAILGKTVPLTGLSYTANSFTVIGVTSRDFGGLEPVIPDFWAPLSLRAVWYQGSHAVLRSFANSVGVIGRLAPGIPLEQARTAIDAIGRRLPVEDSPITAGQVTSKEHLYPPPSDDDLIKRYLPLMAAFGLLLLIACANVANLLLARSAPRRREVAVRLSLGASRTRLVRQMLTESAVLACAGGALSLLFAQALVRWAFEAGGGRIFVAALWAADLYLNVRLDLNVYLYALLVSVIVSLALGLAPALASTGFDLALTVKGSCLDVFGRQRTSRTRDRLVALQVTACLVLLVGAGLLLRSVVNALTFDPGFNPKNLYQVRATRQINGPDDTLLRSAFAERIRPLPFVKAISLSNIDNTGSILVRGPDAGQRIQIFYNAVTPDFFRALELPVPRGRQFTVSEVANGAAVAILSEAAVRALWPGQNPIGRRIEVIDSTIERRGSGPRFERMGGGCERDSVLRGAVFEVIGVTRDLQSVSLSGRQVLPHMYLPRLADACIHSMLIRVVGDGQSRMQTLRQELAALEPGAFLDVFPVADYYLSDLQKIEWLSSVTAMLGALALLLASIGLYGVMSLAVTQRTHEIGVRMALGAATTSVLWLVLSHGLKLALSGGAAGLALAVLLSRAIGPYLFKVSPYDPLTFTTVPALLIAVCLAAAYIPARRATRVDPMVALRQE
jgi:predicted permease